ncbi:hypothetical protein V1523DRAFT_114656 [Lipomyces doorenjongii]
MPDPSDCAKFCPRDRGTSSRDFLGSGVGESLFEIIDGQITARAPEGINNMNANNRNMNERVIYIRNIHVVLIFMIIRTIRINIFHRRTDHFVFNIVIAPILVGIAFKRGELRIGLSVNPTG